MFPAFTAHNEKFIMKHIYLFLIVLLFAGCGTAPPAELPPLAPCKVKVHNNGQPMADVGISFRRVEGHGGWSINGMTDSSGIAVAQTIAGSYEARGLPTGTYRVTLIESIKLPPELINDDDPAMSEKQQKYLAEHCVVPEALRNPAKTPLELTVTESGAELDVDIAKFK